jgi:PIN domain nuclease of toxin-antitoxin system
MALVLDTHIFISLSRNTLASDYPRQAKLLVESGQGLVLSVASIWEISIKTEIGKLNAVLEPKLIEEYCLKAEISILPIHASHASHVVAPQPLTRDPFDRMLLSQCAVEGMKLVTADKMLIDHPLVARL